MTIKKKELKEIYFIFDKGDKFIRKYKIKCDFPEEYIFENDNTIYVSLQNFNDFSVLEQNYFLTLIGTQLYQKVGLGDYEIVNVEDNQKLENIFLGWNLGNYQFNKFKTSSRKTLPKKTLKVSFDSQRIARVLCSVRDLVNQPANFLGPSEIHNFAKKELKVLVDSYSVIKDEKLKKQFPLIYTVGRGAEKNKQPILSKFKWKSKQKRKVKKIFLIGKGVSFDTGGLNLKLGSSMSLMKKDMGGAANCIGLAKLLLQKNLNIELNLLLCLVENSVSEKSMRPSDIVRAKNKMFVEIKDTDAEGRLILADALTFASSFRPDLIIDLATLTGASRVALGTDVPSFFCNNKLLSKQIMQASEFVGDPVWELPLWKNYLSSLRSQHADICNLGNGPFGGAITAALFLEKFVGKNIPWIHVDMMAWANGNTFSPYQGGEAMAIRALSFLIEKISS